MALSLAIKWALREDDDWMIGTSACKCSIRLCLNAAHERSLCKIVMVDTTYKKELSHPVIYACKSINKGSLFVQLLS